MSLNEWEQRWKLEEEAWNLFEGPSDEERESLAAVLLETNPVKILEMTNYSLNFGDTAKEGVDWVNNFLSLSIPKSKADEMRANAKPVDPEELAIVLETLPLIQIGLEAYEK